MMGGGREYRCFHRVAPLVCVDWRRRSQTMQFIGDSSGRLRIDTCASHALRVCVFMLRVSASHYARMSIARCGRTALDAVAAPTPGVLLTLGDCD